MKLIVLSAFGGRLRGEPIEWPDEPMELVLAAAQRPNGFRLGKDIGDGAVVTKRAVFRPTGKYEVLPGGRHAAVYELVAELL